MHRACRNLGTRGLVMQAISAVDIALWDLKARLLDVPLTDLFGRARDTVPVYGSGGFTTLDRHRARRPGRPWAAAGCTAMKIKIGAVLGHRHRPGPRPRQHLRDLAGPGVELMVDANGGYTVGQARRVGAALDDLGVVWFEEPVSSDDLDRPRRRARGGALRRRRRRVRRRPLRRRTGCARWWTACNWTSPAAAVTPGGSAAPPSPQAHNLHVSAHCAPALHAPVAAAVPNLRHVEWFIDHARLEPLLVDGAPTVQHGALQPNDDEPGPRHDHRRAGSSPPGGTPPETPRLRHPGRTTDRRITMNCYDCTGDGRTTPAVAICTSCGAALCGDHTRLETQDHTQAATPGNPSHHRTRSLICTSCDSVLRTVAA